MQATSNYDRQVDFDKQIYYSYEWISFIQFERNRATFAFIVYTNRLLRENIQEVTRLHAEKLILVLQRISGQPDHRTSGSAKRTKQHQSIHIIVISVVHVATSTSIRSLALCGSEAPSLPPPPPSYRRSLWLLFLTAADNTKHICCISRENTSSRWASNNPQASLFPAQVVHVQLFRLI